MIVRRKKRKEGVKRWVGVIDYTIRSLPAFERKRSMVMKIIRRAWIKLLELGTAIGHLPICKYLISLGV